MDIIHYLMRNNVIVMNIPILNKGHLKWRNEFFQVRFEPRSQNLGNDLINDIAKANRSIVVNFGSCGGFGDKSNEGVVESFEKMSPLKEVLDSRDDCRRSGFLETFVKERGLAIRAWAFVGGKGEKSGFDLRRSWNLKEEILIIIIYDSGEKVIKIPRERVVIKRIFSGEQSIIIVKKA